MFDRILRRIRDAVLRTKPAGGTRKETGDSGEDEAERMLKWKGYQILERNFIIQGGEIDLVAWNKGMLVFVEVKTRQNRKFGSPAEGVDWKKRQRLEKAAKVFLLRYGDTQPPCRFDLVEVGTGPGGQVQVNQMEDAFRPGWEAS